MFEFVVWLLVSVVGASRYVTQHFLAGYGRTFLAKGEALEAVITVDSLPERERELRYTRWSYILTPLELIQPCSEACGFSSSSFGVPGYSIVHLCTSNTVEGSTHTSHSVHTATSPCLLLLWIQPERNCCIGSALVYLVFLPEILLQCPNP